MTGLAVKVAMATDMEESPSALILNQGHIVIFGIAGIASPAIPPTHLPTASGVRKKSRSPSNGGTIAPIVVNRATGHVTVPIQRMTKRLFLKRVHGASPNRDLEPNQTIYVIVVAKRVTGHLSVPTRAAHKNGHGDLETERGLRTVIMIHGTAVVPKIAGKGPRTEDAGPRTNAQTLRSSVVKVQIPRIAHGLAHQQNRMTFVVDVVVRGTTPRIAQQSCRGMASF